jgi:protein-disulfide isomerase
VTEQPGRSDRWTLAVVAVAIVLVIVGGGVALQAWRTSRAPSAVPGATAAPAALTPANITSGSPVRFGQPGAPVTMTMYADFHCPHCADLEEKIGPTLTAAQQSGRVTLELYPMAFIDAGSTAASNAVACAAEAGFGEPYYRGLFANSALKWSTSQLTALGDLVAGTAPESFDRCVTDSSHADWVQSINAAADAKGVTGTPTMFLNGNPVDIASLTPDTLETMIEQAPHK